MLPLCYDGTVEKSHRGPQSLPPPVDPPEAFPSEGKVGGGAARMRWEVYREWVVCMPPHHRLRLKDFILIRAIPLYGIAGGVPSQLIKDNTAGTPLPSQGEAYARRKSPRYSTQRERRCSLP